MSSTHEARETLPPRFQAVVFDIGDTLISTDSIVKVSAETAAKKLAHHLPELEWTQLVAEFYAADVGSDWPHINHFYSDSAIVEQSLRASLPCPRASGVDFAPLAAVFLSHYRSELRSLIRPDPILGRTISALRGMRVSLGAVSNGTLVEQVETLVSLGIFWSFDTVVVSEEVGTEKPDRAIFDVARSRLPEGSIESILYVGDNWGNDVVGSARAGFQPALLSPGEIFNPKVQVRDGIPYYVIRSIADVLPLVNS